MHDVGLEHLVVPDYECKNLRMVLRIFMELFWTFFHVLVVGDAKIRGRDDAITHNRQRMHDDVIGRKTGNSCNVAQTQPLEIVYTS
jgi:hypothetical protein